MNSQHSGQKKKDKRTNNDLQNIPNLFISDEEHTAACSEVW
jgi:hypothetical protein